MKEVYQVEVAAANALETAIGTLMAAPYNTTKDLGRLMPRIVDRKEAIRLLVDAAIRKNARVAHNGLKSVVTFAGI